MLKFKLVFKCGCAFVIQTERDMCVCACVLVYIFCWVGGLEALHVNSGGILKKTLPGPPIFQKGKLRFYRMQQVYPVSDIGDLTGVE